MSNFMVASGLIEQLPTEKSVLYIPKYGEALGERFTVVWESPKGGFFGADYRWEDSDFLTAWGDGGWYSHYEVGEPDPFSSGDNRIVAVFWKNK